MTSGDGLGQNVILSEARSMRAKSKDL